jgi:hypothetical protein
MSEAQLRELLSDLADEARSYEVADAAVRGARRRRAARVAAPATLAVVAVLLAAPLVLRPDRPAPSLDRPVGEVAVDPFAITTNLDSRATVVAVFGDLIVFADRKVVRVNSDLQWARSPSGRYLVSRPERYELSVRDVVTGAEVRYSTGSTDVRQGGRLVWSQDERVIAVAGAPADGTGRAPTPAVVVDLRTGRSTLAPAQGTPVGFRPDGALVSMRADDRSVRIAAGSSYRDVSVAALLRPKEYVSDSGDAVLSPDGRTIAAPIAVLEGRYPQSDTWLMLDAITGVPRSRLDIAADLPHMLPCAWVADGILAGTAPDWASNSSYPKALGSNVISVIDPANGRGRSLLRFTRAGPDGGC